MILSGPDPNLPVADICIVGAGPVGLALAFKLESLGMTVMLIEAGHEDGHEQPQIGPLEFLGRHHAASRAVNRRGLGGTSSLWGGRCVAFDDLDFSRRPHVPFSEWPMEHAELARFYPEAFDFLHCNSENLGIPAPVAGDPAVHADAIERWSKNPAVGALYRKRLEASERIFALTAATATDVVLSDEGTQTDHVRVSCHGRSLEIPARSFVLAGGGLENARLLLALQTRWPDKAGGKNGALGRFYQGHLTGYVAVVEFQNPEFARDFVFQTDRKGYLFRRRFQISAENQLREKLLNSVFWIDAISITDPIHGSGALSLLYIVFGISGLYRRLANGLAPRSSAENGADGSGHWHNIRRNPGLSFDIFRLLVASFRRRGKRHSMLFNPRGRYLLRYHAEQIPSPESRVFMEPDGKLSVEYRVTDEDLDSVLRSHVFLDEWLQRNRLGRLEYLHPPEKRNEAVMNQAFDGYHQIGLARMSEDPSQGAADADCRVHGISNLYLAGSCLFPTGGHANPTLPAVALALRLAQHLKERDSGTFDGPSAFRESNPA